MQHLYFWIVAQDAGGRPYLIAGCDTEDETRQKALEMLGNMDFVIRRFATRDISAASQILRGKRVESAHSLSVARQRIGHERSVRRRQMHQGGSSW